MALEDVDLARVRRLRVRQRERAQVHAAAAAPHVYGGDGARGHEERVVVVGRQLGDPRHVLLRGRAPGRGGRGRWKNTHTHTQRRAGACRHMSAWVEGRRGERGG